MANAVGKAHERILTIAVTADESDDTLAVTAVKFYRDRTKYIDSDGYTPAYSGGTAAASCELVLGEVLPPPTSIIMIATFQA
jgi:hypothetical protein